MVSQVPTGSIFDLLGETENEDPQDAIQAVVNSKKAAHIAKGEGASQSIGGKATSSKLTPSVTSSSTQKKLKDSSQKDNGNGNQNASGRVNGSKGSLSSNNTNIEMGPERREGHPNRGGENGRQGGRYNRTGVQNTKGTSKKNDKDLVSEHRDQRKANKYRDKDRQSASGRGYELKRGGHGKGNWGVDGEKGEDGNAPADAENEEVDSTDGDDKEQVEVQMTLDEYYKVLEEKKKAVISTKADDQGKKSAELTAKLEGLSEMKKDEEETSLGFSGVKQAKGSKMKTKKEKEVLPTFFSVEDQNAGRGSRDGRDRRSNEGRGEGRGRNRGHESDGRGSRGGNNRNAGNADKRRDRVGGSRGVGGRGGSTFLPKIDDVQAFPSLVA